MDIQAFDNTNAFLKRARHLLQLSSPETEANGSELMMIAHIRRQVAVPSSPQYAELEAAHLLWALSRGQDPTTRIAHPRDTFQSCEVCGATRHYLGWCKKHYAIARKTRDATEPFKSPLPPSNRPGRPPGPRRENKTEYTLRVSADVVFSLDVVRGSSSRSLTAEAILRSALGLEMTAEMTAEDAR